MKTRHETLIVTRVFAAADTPARRRGSAHAKYSYRIPW